MNRKEFEDALMATIVEYISDQVIDTHRLVRKLLFFSPEP